MGMSTKQILAVFGIAAFAVVGLGATGTLSFGDDNPDNEGNNGIAEGKSATVSAAAFDKAGEGSSQVGTSLYAWRENGDRIYLGKKSGSASSRTDFTNYVTGSTAEFAAFGSTYDYGKMISKAVNTEQELVNVPTWKGISSGNVQVTFYDDGSSTSSTTLGADEEVALDKMKVKANNNGVTYNPHVIAFDKAASTNISQVNVPNANEVAVPKHLADSYDVAYEVSNFGATEGEPVLKAYKAANTGTIEIQADADGTNGETLKVAVLDKAPFINSNDEVAYGVEDDADSPSDVGVGTVTATYTLN
jgi:hypothetical protein